MDIDETMSEEVAFVEQSKEDETFKFDPVKEETTEETESNEEADPALSGENDTVEEEDKRVPYSRFKTKVDELEQRDSVIASLEERLTELETKRSEPTNLDELDVPKEWVELYGDADVSKRAYALQVRREEQLQEAAVQRALQQFRDEANQQETQLENNEAIIDENLENLQQSLGKKITPRMEEDILSIVDEFSPTGADGKYIALYPFDKAYEIYELRNSKATRKTTQARTAIADLTSNDSSGDTDSNSSSSKKGWDSWREAI